MAISALIVELFGLIDYEVLYRKQVTMREACQTEEYRGYNINIYYDEDPESPRIWGNVATFVCEHRHYNLGDEHDIEGAVR